MWTKFRHKVVYVLMTPFFKMYLRCKYGYRSKRYKLEKGPYVFLFNHPTNLDPFMMASSFKRPIYFIANDDLFNIPFVSKLIRYLFAPIPKTKAVKDISTIKNSIKVIKEGGSIGVSPEGNRNYSGRLNHIDIAIVKLLKLLKVPAVLYTIKGGFGVNPRFSTKLRRGKMYGEVARIISKDEILNLSEAELLNIIINNLDVDDTKLGLTYKGEALAEDMESVFYVCPKCKMLHTIYSEKNQIYCNNCKMSAEYLPSLTFKANIEDFKFKTVNEYYLFQEEFIKNLDYDTLEYVDNNVTLREIIKNKRRNDVLTGTLSFNKNGFLVKDNQTKKLIELADIISLAVLYHNTLIINMEKETYQIVGNSKFNALKYLHLFNLIKYQGEDNGILGI